MHRGGGGGNDVWAGLRSDRRTELRFQGLCLHPRIFGPRNGLSRDCRIVWSLVVVFPGIRFRREFSGACIPSFLGVVARSDNWFLVPILWVSFGWGGKDADLLFAQDASISGQFAQ